MKPKQRNNELLNPVSKNRLHENIIAQIEGKILNGELMPGEKLPTERDLAAGLKVNRWTVREALKKLEVLGLVEIRHGDGIYVKDYYESANLEVLKDIIETNGVVSWEVLESILIIRRVITPEMALLAAVKRSDAALDEMDEVVHTMVFNTLLERDLKLHQCIARASGNIVYVFLLNFFNQLFRDYGFMYFSDEDNRAVSEKFHKKIFCAIRDKNATKARSIMAGVLEYTEQKIHEYYHAHAFSQGGMHINKPEGRK